MMACFCNGDPDYCISGVCEPSCMDPCDGPDGDDNCAETCDESTDTCTANDPNGSACTDDGDPSNGSESCMDGQCLSLNPPVCEDCEECSEGLCKTCSQVGKHCFEGQCLDNCPTCTELDEATSQCVKCIDLSKCCRNGQCVETCQECERCDSVDNQCKSCIGLGECCSQEGACVVSCPEGQCCAIGRCEDPSWCLLYDRCCENGKCVRECTTGCCNLDGECVQATPITDWDEYQNCNNRVHDPAHPKSTDGCSSPFSCCPPTSCDPPVNFTEACDEHDWCFTTCDEDFDQCNADFYQAMLEICQNGYPACQSECEGWAASYYIIVSAAPIELIFRDSQVEACECCD